MLNLVPLPSHYLASSSGLGALGVSWSSFIIQLITFILAYLVLRKFAFKPIIKLLNERRKLIDDGVKLGEKMRQEESLLENQIEKELSVARSKADQIIAEAEANSKDIIAQAENKASDRAKNIIDQAELKTKQEFVRSKKKLEAEIVGLIGSVAEEFTLKRVDKKNDYELISKLLSSKDQN